MPARQLLRLGRVCMPPGGSFILMAVMVAMHMLMMMSVPRLVAMIMVMVFLIMLMMRRFSASLKAQESMAFHP
jgi:hypothetical protein